MRRGWRGATAPTSGSGRARSTAPLQPGRSCRRRHRTGASAGRGRRSSRGRSRATGSRSSRAARWPAGRGCSIRRTARRRLVDDPTLGPLVGVAGDRVIAHGACRGFPCRARRDRSWRPGPGRSSPMTPARPSSSSDGRDRARRPRDRCAATAAGCARSRPMARASTDLGPIPDGLGLGDRACGRRRPAAPARLGPARPGRPPAAEPPWIPASSLRHVPDGRSVPLDEVSR